MTRTQPPFRRVLVANRGEIAVRIIRACRDLGMEAVAVYSDADANAAHVRLADAAVRLGPAPPSESYLRIDAVVAAAVASGAEAVHPGYGFLAERAAFARAVEDAGLVYRRTRRRRPSTRSATSSTPGGSRRRVDVPAVPGHPRARRPSIARTRSRRSSPTAEGIGFPLLVKAAAGGGGRGMRRVERAAEPARGACRPDRARRPSAFGDGSVYLEREILPARHVEVQLLADAHGTVVALGERDCSLQRRHQKLVEEAPAPGLSATAATRAARDGHPARRGGRACATRRPASSCSTPTARFWFLEVNTRLQVEHGVTELVAGVDIVREQFLVAAGRAAGRRRRRGRRTRARRRRATRSRCASPPRIRRGRSRRRRVASAGG